MTNGFTRVLRVEYGKCEYLVVVKTRTPFRPEVKQGCIRTSKAFVDLLITR
jgi:hypothetical protein